MIRSLSFGNNLKWHIWDFIRSCPEETTHEVWVPRCDSPLSLLPSPATALYSPEQGCGCCRSLATPPELLSPATDIPLRREKPENAGFWGPGARVRPAQPGPATARAAALWRPLAALPCGGGGTGGSRRRPPNSPALGGQRGADTKAGGRERRGSPWGLSGPGLTARKNRKSFHAGLSKDYRLLWFGLVVIREGDVEAFVRPQTGGGRKRWWQSFWLPHGTARCSCTCAAWGLMGRVSALPKRTWDTTKIISQKCTPVQRWPAASWAA